MDYDISVESVPEQPIVSIRDQAAPAEISGKLGELLPELARFIAQSGAEMAGMPITVWHDFGDSEMDFEAAIPVDGPVQGAGRIVFRRLPGGTVATTVHRGSYQRSREAHEAVMRWMRENGREPAGAPWESYLNDPGEVPDPADYETRVCHPIR